jgi:hypothetical protein
MQPPLDEWDDSYLLKIATPHESAELEKKGADRMDLLEKKKETREELARQVCAFANSGGGFIVYGIPKAGGFDAGVADTVGTTPIKAWIEQEIPKMLQPPCLGCRAKYISISGKHAADRGVLVVYIPPSDRRPHWLPGSPDIAYIRAGKHSFSMRHQTFLDISQHGGVPQAEIVDLGISKGGELAPQVHFIVKPMIRIVSGPLCSVWGFELRGPADVPAGYFQLRPESPDPRIVSREAQTFSWTSAEPLFPGRLTPASPVNFLLTIVFRPEDDLKELTATLSAGSSFPVTKTMAIREFKALHESPAEVKRFL